MPNSRLDEIREHLKELKARLARGDVDEATYFRMKNELLSDPEEPLHDPYTPLPDPQGDLMGLLWLTPEQVGEWLGARLRTDALSIDPLAARRIVRRELPVDDDPHRLDQAGWVDHLSPRQVPQTVGTSACRSARGSLALGGAGGLAQAFLKAGAGAVVGTHWSIVDECAPHYARAFNSFFFQGKPIDEAARQARLRLREDFPGDPTWLAYTLFAHPRAAAYGPEELVPLPRREEPFLEVPWHVWRPDRSPPGALLRADRGIVPFHSREQEIEQLFEWCAGERPVRVRLYTGPGGIGKTLLSLELCHRLRDQGWRTGLVKSAADASAEEAARSLIASGGPMLAVDDYAETRRSFLVPLLRELLNAEDDGPFRLILLLRWREDWWDQLKVSPNLVGDLIAGPDTSHHALAPLALSTDDRAATYHKAAEAYAGRLERPVPEGLPEDIEAKKYFEPVPMLHMSALGAVEGVPLKGENGILDWVLDRERKFWRTQLGARELALNLMPGVGRAMSAITHAGGAISQEGTVQLLKALKFFEGQPRSNLASIAHLMHDTYPGEHTPNPRAEEFDR